MLRLPVDFTPAVFFCSGQEHRSWGHLSVVLRRAERSEGSRDLSPRGRHRLRLRRVRPLPTARRSGGSFTWLGKNNRLIESTAYSSWTAALRQLVPWQLVPWQLVPDKSSPNTLRWQLVPWTIRLHSLYRPWSCYLHLSWARPRSQWGIKRGFWGACPPVRS